MVMSDDAEQDDLPSLSDEQREIRIREAQREAMYEACFLTEAGQFVLDDLKGTFHYEGSGIAVNAFPLARVGPDQLNAVFGNQMAKKPIEHILSILTAAVERRKQQQEEQ